MIRVLIWQLLAVFLCWAVLGRACVLTRTWYDEESGLLHRCLNLTGSSEWHLNVACWIRSLDDVRGGILVLEVGQNYSLANGRIVAECRSRFQNVARVYYACFDGNDSRSSVRWPGDVWTGSDGFPYFCTNASKASGSYFGQSSRAIIFGCKSTINGRVVTPGSSELLDKDNLERKCVFSGTEQRNFQYTMEIVGCCLQSRSNSREIVRLASGQHYYLPEGNGRNQSILATCRRYTGKWGLVYNLCRENGTSGEILRQPGSVWNGSDGIQRECRPADSMDLSSAQIIVRACYENGSVFTPGSVSRKSDGSIVRCVFNKYKSAYGWFEVIGCWLKAPSWSKLTLLNPDIPAGKEFCPDDNLCLARCEKRRFREEVALLPLVCMENVGKDSIYRLPSQNWTDERGLHRTCVPMADQSSRFGVGAETILNGCESNGSHVSPQTLFYGKDFVVYECGFNSYERRYKSNKMVGCWMHDSHGQLVRMASGEALRLSNGKKFASCRKRYNEFRLTVEVCFKGRHTSTLNWTSSSIALPGDILTTDAGIFTCDPAPIYTEGQHARWIVFGCPSVSGVDAPGAKRFSENGIIRECAHNGRGGASAAYSWAQPVGCWFRDHLNQTIAISHFNILYNHSVTGKATARCKKGSSDPELELFVCFSVANRRYYEQGEEWTDLATGWAKRCVWAPQYKRVGVTETYAGCWQNSASEATAPGQRAVLSRSGAVTYSADNRVVRCEFNEGNQKYEWGSSKSCWYNASGTRIILPSGQDVWSNGILIYRCRDSRNGVTLVQYACQHIGAWHDAFDVWQDTSYRYTCVPAFKDRPAKTEKTHCITDDGQAIQESQKIKGIQYVCIRICGFLVFFRDPTPQQYRLLMSFINNCNAINSNIIGSIG